MISIVDKFSTLREAKAVSIVSAKAETISRLVSNDLPKKDVLQVARVAGIQAAKNTSSIIPYCHPLPIDFIEVDFAIESERILVTSTVKAIWKTGVEMEALISASISALTIYDMLKPIDKNLEIVSTKLILKKGGKSSFRDNVPENFKAAVIVTSDGTYAGKREDKSGLIIKEYLEKYNISPLYIILPDEKKEIEAKLLELCESNIDLIITTGGTGLSYRDVTVEATKAVIDREIPGISETARAYGQSRTPYSMLSRGICGQKGNTLIVNLPGSSRGTVESLNLLFPSIFHSFPMMKGGGH